MSNKVLFLITLCFIRSINPTDIDLLFTGPFNVKSGGNDRPFVLAILISAFLASISLPFTSNHRGDSGIYLEN